MRYISMLTTLLGLFIFIQPLGGAETPVPPPEGEPPAEEAAAEVPAEEEAAPEIEEPAAEVPEEPVVVDTLDEEMVPEMIEPPVEEPVAEEEAPELEEATAAVSEPEVEEEPQVPLVEEPEPTPEPVLAEEEPTASPDEEVDMQDEQEEPVLAEGTESEEVAPEEPEVTEELVPEEGIDTVGLEGGNWLFNRVWWKHAEEKYEKIKQQVNRVMDARLVFFTERNKADRDIFDPFYIHVGFDRGELEEIIFDLLKELEKERDADELSDKEQQLIERLQEKKGVLEQLKIDVLTITKLDEAINQALDRLIEEINKTRQYEQQAWDTFKKMARLLDDEENKKLYYEMDRLSRSITAIDRYIGGNFANYFNEQLLRAARDKVEQVQGRVKELKEKDVLDLKKEAERLEELDREGGVYPESIEGTDMQDDLEDEEEPGWFATIWETLTKPFMWIWKTISGWISSLYGMILGPAQPTEAEVPEMPVVPEEALSDTPDFAEAEEMDTQGEQADVDAQETAES